MLHNKENKICIRKLAGIICISAGILLMFTKTIYFMATDIMIPFDGRGQLLVITGAGLLGLTTIDSVRKS